MGWCRIGARIVGCLDLFYSSLGLVRFVLWIMDPLVWTNSLEGLLHIIIILGLILGILAAILLLVATKDRKSPVVALKRCVSWRYMNAARICLDGLSTFLLILLMMLHLPVSIKKWIPAIIPVLEIDVGIRLVALYVVVKFMDTLRTTMVNNQHEIPLHTFPISRSRDHLEGIARN